MSPAALRAGVARRFGVALVAMASFPQLWGGPVLAQVPEEFRGDWTSHPARCEQDNGEVDLLTVEETRLGFYEVGCEKLTDPRKGRLGSMTFEAVCFKGGSPETKGRVELSRQGENEIRLKLTGFAWIAPAFQTFHRCQRSR